MFNLKVEYADAERAVRELAANQLIEQVRAGSSPSGLTLTRPNITITPEPDVLSWSRTITWNLNLLIAHSDEGDLEEFEEVVNALFDGAQMGAGQAMSAVAGLPLAAKDVLLTIGRTLGRVSNALQGEQSTRVLAIDALPVTFEDRRWRPVFLDARLYVEAYWLTDDPDDDGNKAWIELESFKLGSIVDGRALPNQWDASDWDPLQGAPAGHLGRSFMEPHGDDDLTGAFKTEPGANPRPFLYQAVGSDLQMDRIELSSHVSVNARADDTVAVLVRRMRLQLTATVPGPSLFPSATKTINDQARAAEAEAREAAGDDNPPGKPDPQH